MKRLLKCAEKIKDEDLRKKVVDYIKDHTLSNKNFKKYKPENLDDAGSYFGVSSSSLGPVERDVVNHTLILTEVVEEVAKIYMKRFGLKLEIDNLIAASLVHDIAKTFENRRDKDGDLEPTGISLDHTMLGVAELFARDFPEEVIHIVASHPGESSPTPPRSFEAVIFHNLDSLCSVVEYYVMSRKRIAERILALSDDQLSMLGGDSEELE
jgi:7,8-dihydroneopterin 2',3'-cyclic phosphate phosphodiesterase